MYQISWLVAEKAILDAVDRWPKDMVIVLYCFWSKQTISTIVLRSHANFDCLTSYDSLFLKVDFTFFQIIPGYSRLFQIIPGYSKLIPDYSSLYTNPGFVYHL